MGALGSEQRRRGSPVKLGDGFGIGRASRDHVREFIEIGRLFGSLDDQTRRLGRRVVRPEGGPHQELAFGVLEPGANQQIGQMGRSIIGAGPPGERSGRRRRAKARDGGSYSTVRIGGRKTSPTNDVEAVAVQSRVGYHDLGCVEYRGAGESPEWPRRVDREVVVRR